MHIVIESLSKGYAEHQVQALSDINMAVRKGEFVALMGPSGCGKSTLLNIMAGIDRATAGSVTIAGVGITNLSDDELTAFRRDKIGFVFQFFNLLSTLNVFENVALPLELSGQYKQKEIDARVTELLAHVGLTDRANFYPAELSGGQMQRIAVARALAHNPELIIADEPTGNLDTENGDAVLNLIQTLCKERGHTAVMATHSAEAAARADRVIQMKDGHVLAGTRT